ncbi:MAG: hypothetical protein JXA69_07930 [Phycisphaerae bacterium]|nr:hypothetical protein [Phycisphaerae bacterium]
MSSVAKFVAACVFLAVLIQVGCGGGVPSPSVSTVRVDIINRTGNNLELDVVADGIPFTFACVVNPASGEPWPCRYDLGFCPATVQTVGERWLDGEGRVIGGRDFSSTTAFDLGAGSFQCGAILTWDVSKTEMSVQAF